MAKRKTAGELSQQIAKDNTKYDSREVGHALADEIPKHVRQCIDNHYKIIDEPEFCVVMVIATDPLIHTVKRRKFYAWPYLPSPRPNQAVWLYRKANDSIKRLWVLPSDMVMAELATLQIVHKKYKTMQAWSVAFFEGKFWEYIRYEHNITMPSEKEYLAAHRDELIKAGCKVPDATFSDPFDFSKIAINKVVDPVDIISNKSIMQPLGQT